MLTRGAAAWPCPAPPAGPLLSRLFPSPLVPAGLGVARHLETGMTRCPRGVPLGPTPADGVPGRSAQTSAPVKAAPLSGRSGSAGRDGTGRRAGVPPAAAFAGSPLSVAAFCRRSCPAGAAFGCCGRESPRRPRHASRLSAGAVGVSGCAPPARRRPAGFAFAACLRLQAMPRPKEELGLAAPSL